MKKYITPLLLCTLIACAGEEQEPTLVDVIEQEKAEIRAFLAARGSASVTPIVYLSKKGQVIDTAFLIDHTPATTTPEHGDFILHDYSLRRLDGHYIESTDPTITADTFRYAVAGPLYLRVDTSKHYDYVADALARVAPGSTAELIVPSILLDKSGTTRHYTLSPHRVIRDLFTHEKALIQDYLTATNATATYQDGRGDTLVHTIIRVPGAGDRLVLPGDTLTIHRTLLVLRSDAPLHEAFSLDTLTTDSFDPTRVEIPSCGPAFARLREGDEVEFVIPYLLAFNDKPAFHPADARKLIPWIPPYSTLIYSLKIARLRPKN
ncbi:MAG: hypothetical protein LBG30_05120 [Odoribacteraceae bacterium]|jgi:hypothetical protein|nr:hypothetical protein [Odoribacteraceae bacterium]